jgi:ligand-binding SRPBCC domain-containing protein
MQFVKESRIAASPDRVFAFHESPGALRRLTPPWERLELESGGQSIRVGSRVVLRTRLGPIPLRWVAEHVEYRPPHLFADVQLSGPFARWHHRHEFLDDGQGGTILRDVVDYELPMGALGRWFGGGLVRSRLARMFKYRHDATRRIVESGDFPDA